MNGDGRFGEVTARATPAGSADATEKGVSVVGRVRQIAKWSDRAAADPRHDQRTAAILGISLAVAFGTCFLTGMYSHLAQHPPSWFTLPAQPAGLFRVTQGLHVATGIASVPLLLAKLWSVYPQFVKLPPVRSVLHLVERLSLVPLVAGALFLLYSGIANIDLWYPLPVFFPTAHYWVAWLTIGALVAHIGAKLPITREVLRRRVSAADDPPCRANAVSVHRPQSPPRRRFLLSVAGASGVLTLLTVGQTVVPLRRFGLLAPRDPDVGTDGFPVNNTAEEARVTDAASNPAWLLTVVGAVAAPLELSVADLQSFPQHEAVLPIACVEGWSASRRWRGVRLADVLARAEASPGCSVTVRSLETGLYAQSDINPTQAAHPDTLLALEADGKVLSLDHGYPVRLIGPNRPGVMQTKWLSHIEVHA